MTRPVPLRRNRAFVLLWTGQLVSTVGSAVSGLALPLLVLALTHSAGKAGLVGFAGALGPLVFTLPAGVLVDRWNRKLIMLTADAVNTCVLAAIAALVLTHTVTLLELIVCTFLSGSAAVFFGVSEGAALPQVVEHEQLQQAVAQNEARGHSAGIASQPLGGLLFALGQAVPFLFNTVCYAISFLTLLFIRPPFQEQRKGPRTAFWTDATEGLRWLRNDRFLRTVVLIFMGTDLGHAALGLALVVRAKDLGASAALIGLMFSCISIGGLLGAFVAPFVQRRFDPRIVILGTLWIWCADTLALVFVNQTLLLGAVVGVQAVVGSSANVVLTSYWYPRVPDRLRGRIISGMVLVLMVSIATGPLIAGFMLQTFDPRLTLAAIGILFVGVATLATLSKEVRSMRRIAEPVRIRDAGPEDAELIEEVHQAARATWTSVVPIVASIDAPGSLLGEVAAGPGTLALVAEQTGRIVGYAIARLQGNGSGQLDVLATEPSAWHAGAGQTLNDAVVRRLRELGCTAGVLWTAEEAPEARRFCEAAGWQTDGTRRTRDWHGSAYEELRYQIDL